MYFLSLFISYLVTCVTDIWKEDELLLLFSSVQISLVFCDKAFNKKQYYCIWRWRRLSGLEYNSHPFGRLTVHNQSTILKDIEQKKEVGKMSDGRNRFSLYYWLNNVYETENNIVWNGPTPTHNLSGLICFLVVSC